jgi:hypothetical protein
MDIDIIDSINPIVKEKWSKRIEYVKEKKKEVELVEPHYSMCFSYVKDLMETHPELVGNCSVFINWPEPSNSEYDIESIKLLKPRHILTICETTGSAGGRKFLEWLDINGVKTDERCYPDDKAEYETVYGKYKVVSCVQKGVYESTPFFGSDFFRYTIAWLTLQDEEVTLSPDFFEEK